MSTLLPDLGDRDWRPDAAVGGVVLLIGLVEAAQYGLYDPYGSGIRFLVALAMAGAAASFRLSPAAALTLIWVGCGLQAVTGTAILAVELAAVLVSFGCARFGSTGVLWASGLSIPVGAFFALLFQVQYGVTTFGLIYRFDLPYASRLVLYGLVALVGFLLLVVPWLVGLLMRSRAATRVSQEEQHVAETGRDQALEIARLRAEQTQLAHDVHDVVGHSLAVILAQAESAQYLPDDDPARIKQTMANIATSARESLRDVRQVLAGAEERRTAAPANGLDSLVDGVRSAGNDVDSVVVGTPQPLPPELDAVAYRVLQEMLTNALKHGRRGEPVHVERHWEGDLRIEVRNVVGELSDETRPIQEGTGLGVEGMRQRLESVGGRLDVRRRQEATGTTYTATAWIPLRPTKPGPVTHG